MENLLEDIGGTYKKSSQLQGELFVKYFNGEISCTEEEFLDQTGIMRAIDFERKWLK